MHNRFAERLTLKEAVAAALRSPLHADGCDSTAVKFANITHNSVLV